MTFIALPLSSFLDLGGYRTTSETTVAEAYGFKDGEPFDGDRHQPFNLGIMLNRQRDPAELLAGDWGSRQRRLQQLQAGGTLWSTYGADPDTYNQIASALAASSYNLTVLTSSDSNYVSGPESRMIWVEINTAEDFRRLFNSELFYSSSRQLAYWNGELSLPAEFAADVAGLWVDTSTVPRASNLTPGVSASLDEGPLSSGSASTAPALLAPQQIAGLYNFPLQGQNVRTGTIGLIEPAVGTYLPGDPTGTSFAQLLKTYLNSIGQTQLPGGGGVVVQGVDGQSRSGSSGDRGERSLDVGVSAAVNPNSLLALYNGSGSSVATGNAQASTFTAAQSAIWDQVNDPAVTSNSFGDAQVMRPGSPFYNAYWQLFVDAALRNQTTVIALGDGGSGNETGNGLTNVEINVTQPYNLLVGGTSITTLNTAASDPTLSQGVDGTPSLLSLALAGDPATLWGLIRSGLTQMPSASTPDQWLLEAVWNTYNVQGSQINATNDIFDGGYLVNSTSSGGVDPSQAIPAYQQDYGLAPVTSDPYRQVGRGVPDVAALAGGNLNYLAPTSDLQSTSPDGGTSAASPLWASLLTQVNTIFADQGLPRLGYINDLLYTAAVVSPGSFNDVATGNNTSSYTQPGPYITVNNNGDSRTVQPTGFGYEAGPDYDLVSGLGSPNGTLLAIALTNLAHSQLSRRQRPAVLLPDGEEGLVSGARQSLLWQVSTPAAASVTLDINSRSTEISTPASAPYAWTSRLAQQSLQQDFDASLVRLFDGQPQGALLQTSVEPRDPLAVLIDSSQATTPQLQLSDAYGFADFVAEQGAVRAARPVCVATTPADADDSPVLVRMRQNGVDDQALFFYRVDDLTGTIEGVTPGAAGYGEAALQRRYGFSDGQQLLDGAGYGNYCQGVLNGVNAGDLIAMGLINQTSGRIFWGFAEANQGGPGSGMAHLWNYGFNTYGFEDTFGGGDRDFNDSVVQLDFSSATGSQYLL